MSYYDNFLNPKDLAYMEDAKNRTGKIVYMTPEEYYEACVEYCFPDTTVERLKEERTFDSESLKYHNELLDRGEKFNLCFINKTNNGQEGLHRMMVVGNRYGWNNTKYPVLIVSYLDEEIEKELELRRNISEFEFNYMDDIVDYVLWSNYYLEDVENTEQWRQDFCQKLSERTKDELDKDILFDCEFEGDDLWIWIINYEGVSYTPATINKHYDYKKYVSNEPNIDDIVSNDDDGDLLDLFFK